MKIKVKTFSIFNINVIIRTWDNDLTQEYNVPTLQSIILDLGYIRDLILWSKFILSSFHEFPWLAIIQFS